MIISAPGKLFIAGEWAILEKGNPGIVAAIDKRAYVRIQRSKDKKIYIKIEDFNIENLKASFWERKLKFQKKLTKRQQEKLAFIKCAIETSLIYLGKYEPFRIETDTQEMYFKINDRKREIGFGSSAAIVVATVAGILKFHGIDIENPKVKDKIYKLSALAHYFTQEKIGSGFDIAASTFGGVFIYKRFDPEWLVRKIKQNKDIKEVIEMKWPGFYFREIILPDDFGFIVGWTGQSASTREMVKKLYKWKDRHEREYKRILGKIANLVKKLIRAWKKNDEEEILKLLKRNEDYLRELGRKSGVSIETRILKKLSEIANKYGAAGKLSGAGGGDCGIAVSFNKKVLEEVEREWKRAGIYPIKTKISFSGTKEEQR